MGARLNRGPWAARPAGAVNGCTAGLLSPRPGVVGSALLRGRHPTRDTGRMLPVSER